MHSWKMVMLQVMKVLQKNDPPTFISKKYYFGDAHWTFLFWDFTSCDVFLTGVKIDTLSSTLTTTFVNTFFVSESTTIMEAFSLIDWICLTFIRLNFIANILLQNSMKVDYWVFFAFVRVMNWTISSLIQLVCV